LIWERITADTRYSKRYAINLIFLMKNYCGLNIFSIQSDSLIQSFKRNHILAVKIHVLYYTY
jgi:hypothetical protein